MKNYDDKAKTASFRVRKILECGHCQLRYDITEREAPKKCPNPGCNYQFVQEE